MADTDTHKCSTHILEQLFSDLKCDLCLQVYIEPTMTTCRHIYCHFCITKWLEYFHKCPQCLSSVHKLTQMPNIKDQITTIFKTFPPSLRLHRHQVEEARIKLEKETFDTIMEESTLLQKLRAPPGLGPRHLELTSSEQNWLSKFSSYLTQVKPFPLNLTPNQTENDLQGSSNSPKLPPINVNNDSKGRTDNKINLNIKLPPIKQKGRHVRSITTTTMVQKDEDKFPKGMEGDHQEDTVAQENIRVLERHNKYLEDQLFGAYDRIMDTINESDQQQQAEQLKVQTQTPGSNSNMEEPGTTNDVDALLAETEDLMEIEEFLKQFPFERIRDDEELIGYNSDDGLSLDGDTETAGKIKLTKDQEAIENFYKKLELKGLKGNLSGNVSSKGIFPGETLPESKSIPGPCKTQVKTPSLTKITQGTNSKMAGVNSTKNLAVNSKIKMPIKGNKTVKIKLNKEIRNVKKIPVIPLAVDPAAEIMKEEESLDSSLGLSYDDFLKLEIDFLDGNGDWKEFTGEKNKTRDKDKNLKELNGNFKKLESAIRSKVKDITIGSNLSRWNKMDSKKK